jgi:prepilin-type N-terminal cleavage/methylation domain-containing protein
MRRRQLSGFTLLETMIALAILAGALVGTLAGFIDAGIHLKEAPLRNTKAILLDAKVQRLLLTNKTEFAPLTAAWAPDPTQVTVNQINTPTPRPIPDPDIDFSIGAFFKLLPNGEITQLNVTAGTLCSSTAVPDGTYCRELMLTPGMPNGVALPANPPWTALAGVANPQTLWIRIYRKGQDPVRYGNLQRQVFLQ